MFRIYEIRKNDSLRCFVYTIRYIRQVRDPFSVTKEERYLIQVKEGCTWEASKAVELTLIVHTI